MTLIRWEPFRDVLGPQGVGRLFSDVPGFWGSEELDGWVPAMDIFEKEDDLVIRAELPGVGAEEIDVRVENDTLILRGERRQDVEVEKGKSYRRERSFGTFTRRFSLPTTVDASKISAQHNNGVLELVLPKLEEAKPRKVEIRVA